MSIKIGQAKLFIIKNNDRLRVQITQNFQILFSLETVADRSPIIINLPLIEGNQPIFIQVNDKTASIHPDELELNKQYKLTIKDGELKEGTISSDDDCALTFKVLQSIDIRSSNTSVISGSQKSQIKHNLYQLERGTSEYQSASSLRHSIPEVSFCQAQRFQKELINSTEFNYNIPNNIGSGRSSSFGYGNKQIAFTYVQKNAEQNPPPNAYFLGESKQFQQKKKTNWPVDDRWKVSQSDFIPGPASYEISHPLGIDKPASTIAIKYKLLSSFQESVPAPNTYEVKQKIIEPSRYANISFGYGEKIDFTKNAMTPGPGAYEQPSIFRSNSKSILNNGSIKQSVMRK